MNISDHYLFFILSWVWLLPYTAKTHPSQSWFFTLRPPVGFVDTIVTYTHIPLAKVHQSLYSEVQNSEVSGEIFIGSSKKHIYSGKLSRSSKKAKLTHQLQKLAEVKDKEREERLFTPRENLGDRRLPISLFTVGEHLTGRILKIKPFGMWVDIGCKQNGLLHIKDIANSWINDLSDYYTPGEITNVTVKYVDIERGIIGLTKLSLPEAAISMIPKPHDNDDVNPFLQNTISTVNGCHRRSVDAFQVEEQVTGRITKITNLGFYLDIGADVAAFLHVMDVDNPATHRDLRSTAEFYKIDQVVDNLYVKSVDLFHNRIQLTTRDWEAELNYRIDNGIETRDEQEGYAPSVSTFFDAHKSKAFQPVVEKSDEYVLRYNKQHTHTEKQKASNLSKRTEVNYGNPEGFEYESANTARPKFSSKQDDPSVLFDNITADSLEKVWDRFDSSNGYEHKSLLSISERWRAALNAEGGSLETFFPDSSEMGGETMPIEEDQSFEDTVWKNLAAIAKSTRQLPNSLLSMDVSAFQRNLDNWDPATQEVASFIFKDNPSNWRRVMKSHFGDSDSEGFRKNKRFNIIGNPETFFKPHKRIDEEREAPNPIDVHYSSPLVMDNESDGYQSASIINDDEAEAPASAKSETSILGLFADNENIAGTFPVGTTSSALSTAPLETTTYSNTALSNAGTIHGLQPTHAIGSHSALEDKVNMNQKEPFHSIGNDNTNRELPHRTTPTAGPYASLLLERVKEIMERCMWNASKTTDKKELETPELFDNTNMPFNASSIRLDLNLGNTPRKRKRHVTPIEQLLNAESSTAAVSSIGNAPTDVSENHYSSSFHKWTDALDLGKRLKTVAFQDCTEDLRSLKSAEFLEAIQMASSELSNDPIIQGFAHALNFLETGAPIPNLTDPFTVDNKKELETAILSERQRQEEAEVSMYVKNVLHSRVHTHKLATSNTSNALSRSASIVPKAVVPHRLEQQKIQSLLNNSNFRNALKRVGIDSRTLDVAKLDLKKLEDLPNSLVWKRIVPSKKK